MPLCFAIMPISTPTDALERYNGDSQHFARVAKYIFAPAAETIGFEFKAPASTSSEIIQAEIIKYLEEADLVLCDISLWNPNVFFELGIRVALDRPVAMVKDSFTDKIPFDNALVNCHTYNPSMDVWSVEQEVPKLQEFLAVAKDQTQNALWKYFGITQRAERIDIEDPENVKLDLLLAEMGVLRDAVADLSGAKGARRSVELADLWRQISLARDRDVDARTLTAIVHVLDRHNVHGTHIKGVRLLDDGDKGARLEIEMDGLIPQHVEGRILEDLMSIGSFGGVEISSPRSGNDDSRRTRQVRRHSADDVAD